MPDGRHNMPGSPNARWRTSTYSGGNNEYVEVANNLPHLVPVRDSKRPTGPVIAFGHDAWHAFVSKLLPASDSHAWVVPDPSGTTHGISVLHRAPEDGDWSSLSPQGRAELWTVTKAAFSLPDCALRWSSGEPELEGDRTDPGREQQEGR